MLLDPFQESGLFFSPFCRETVKHVLRDGSIVFVYKQRFQTPLDALEFLGKARDRFIVKSLLIYLVCSKHIARPFGKLVGKNNVADCLSECRFNSLLPCIVFGTISLLSRAVVIHVAFF